MDGNTGTNDVRAIGEIPTHSDVTAMHTKYFLSSSVGRDRYCAAANTAANRWLGRIRSCQMTLDAKSATADDTYRCHLPLDRVGTHSVS